MKITEIISKLKKPKVLLLAVIVCAVGGYACYAIMNATVMAQPWFCATCHNMQSEYDTYTHEGYLAHKHAQEDVTCHDCHEPTLAQQMNEGWLFITGQYEEPMPQYGYDNKQCLREGCHEWNEVVEATAYLGDKSPHNGTHEVGNEPPQCMDCHSVHHKQSTAKCNQCHEMKWEDLDDSWAVSTN